ncbi:MAG TPA: recombination protein NinB [Methylophilaceae bacterium]|nr:recombination protein NinB [Methylophilaceae bacterium]
MTRDKYPTKTIHLVGDMQKATARLLIDQSPVDPMQPIEVVIREKQKVRKPDQNSLMWSGPLADISEQAYINGRTYSPTIWHEHYKELYLPEEFDAELCKEGYKKWDYKPNGGKVLIGSTTQLTVKGFALYLEQVYADGASMGVQFHERRAA